MSITSLACIFDFLALFTATRSFHHRQHRAIVLLRVRAVYFHDAADAPRVLTSKEVMQEGFWFDHSTGIEVNIDGLEIDVTNIVAYAMQVTLICCIF